MVLQGGVECRVAVRTIPREKSLRKSGQAIFAPPAADSASIGMSRKLFELCNRGDTVMRRQEIVSVIVVLCSCLALGNLAPARAADPGDEYWSPAYYQAGVAGYLYTMLSQPGAVYVGGSFNAITDVAAANVARLEMSGGQITQVVPLGAGFDNQVKALCIHDGDIIAVGSFIKSGATTLNKVGRWDGADWQPLGDGLPDVWPNCVASFQGQIYAGKYRWDGANWSQLFDTNSGVTTLTVHDGLLYVGGNFTEVAGQPQDHVFAWDGAQILSLGNGFPFDIVSASAGSAGVVFAGRENYGLGQVARWDGATWTVELDSTIVRAVTYYGTDLVADASLYQGGGMFTPSLHTNQGGTWHSLGHFYTGVFVEHDGILLAKAATGVEPGVLSPGLIAYNGVHLQGVFPAASGFDGRFRSLAPLGDSVLVGGDFRIADGQEFDGSALASPGQWSRWGNRSDLPVSPDGTFSDIAVVGSQMYAVYDYSDYDVSVQILTQLVWDGTALIWQPVDTGTWFSGILQTVGGELFNVNYGTGVSQIDLVTGVATPVPGFDVNGTVYGTCDYLGTLTVCGSFSTNNGAPSSSVIRNVNGTWEDVGDLPAGLRTLAVEPMDGVRLAASRWVASGLWQVSIFDGETWSTLPGDFDGTVSSLVYHRGRLIAGGSFDHAGLVPAPGVAVWTGDQWAPIGSGLEGRAYGRVTDMASVGDDLYVVGGFVATGGHPSAGFARWSGDPALITGAPSAVPDNLPTAAHLLGDAFPNPFNPRTVVSFTAPQAGRVQIGIFDLRGNRVRELVNEDFAAGSYSRTWNGLDDAGQAMPSGVYFARMLTGGAAEAVKLTLVR